MLPRLKLKFYSLRLVEKLVEMILATSNLSLVLIKAFFLLISMKAEDPSPPNMLGIIPINELITLAQGFLFF